MLIKSKSALTFLFFILFLTGNLKIKACSPLTVPNLLSQSLSGNNLVLSWESTNIWSCDYTIEVEITCMNAAFTGSINYVSDTLYKATPGPQAYPQQLIGFSALCPGTVYQFRARESDLSGAGIYSPWTSVFTFTTPGVFVQPQVSVGSASATICGGQTVQLNALASGACGNTSYAWTPTLGLSCTTCSNPVVSPTVTTTYTCVISGCSTGGTWASSDSVQVTVNALAGNLSLTAPASVCPASSVTISFIALSGATVQWQKNVGGNTWMNLAVGNSTTCAIPSVTANSCFRGVYNFCNISYTSAVSCVSVWPLPVLSISPGDSSLCDGSSTGLTAGGASNYTWSTGATTSSIIITPTATTTYTLYGADDNNCVNSTSFTQSVSICTSQAEMSGFLPGLKIYPNPAQGEINIAAAKDLELKMTDATGSLIRHVFLNQGNRYHVAIDGLASGIYFIVVQSGQTRVSQKLIIIN